MRQLATIREIKDIQPIEKADRLELAFVDGWQVVVGKGEFKVGDEVVYFEVDSFLPCKPEFEFLRKSCFKKMYDGREGFRLKTIRLRGALSQGLIMSPLALCPTKDLGDDVTELLGVIKWELAPPDKMSIAQGKKPKGTFPPFLRKTDQERLQNLSKFYDELKTKTYEITEKIDGTSGTFFLNKGKFGVCSRNFEIKRDTPFSLKNWLKDIWYTIRGKRKSGFIEGDLYWAIAKKYQIEDLLRIFGKNMALQGEIVGPGIQDNKYNLTEKTFYLFDIYNIDEKRYLLPDERKLVHMALKHPLVVLPFPLMHVPVLEFGKLPDTLEEAIKKADGESVITKGRLREGLVYKCMDKNLSFKTVSNQFLLKHED